MARTHNKYPLKKIKALTRELTITHPNAAGIDVGAYSHHVAVPSDRDEYSVREFGCYTPDLQELAAWLKQCGITTVAMEATGVYWIGLYQLLLSLGFEVIVVNPHQVKQISGRKTDVSDCQWIQQLHAYGLLKASFLPSRDMHMLQTYWRQRERLIQQAADAIRLMQKALDLMSLHLHKAISDLSGVTGLRIVRAMVGGEQDPRKLATMRDRNIRCDYDELVKALTGDYRQDYLFTLGLALEQYDFFQTQILQCETNLQTFLATLSTPAPPDDATAPPPSSPRRKRQGKNQPSFNLASELDRLSGKALTSITGLGPSQVMTIIAEVGLDLTKFPTEQHFSSWLGLSPNRRITGGKVKSSRTRKVVNRASTALRLAAQAVGKSHTALGAFYRQKRAALGAPKAVTATAHRLAVHFYRLLRYGQAYVEMGERKFEERFQERSLRSLQKRATAMGYQLVSIAA
jgi:transposase